MAFINTSDLGKVQDALMSRDPAACAVAIGIITNARDGLADPGMREAANDRYGTDDIEIDDEPATSAGEGGTWVAAWVWIEDPEEEEEEGEEFPSLSLDNMSRETPWQNEE